MKPVLVWDLEVYKNYFLCMFKNIETGNVRAFELFEGQPFDADTVRKILKAHTIVSFNGNSFDLPLLSMALSGADNALLKKASDNIILNNVRSWALERQFNFKTITKVDHIDLIEVAPGMVSLKIYGGRLHTPTMQDLPIEPNASISVSDRARLREYCANDLSVTQALYEHLLPQIKLREAMGAEYGLDLRSKSDAQIAEHVIKSQVAALKKTDVTRPDIPAGTTFQYRAPQFIRFSDPALTEIVTKLQAHKFTVTSTGKVDEPAWMKSTVKIGDGAYKMGIGGLHSTESCVAHIADDDTLLVDRDVASYYPSIILGCDLAPAHMGEAFTRVYRTIVERRLEAKHKGDKVTADTLKICVNGSFGKLGSKWSVLYSPDLLIQVTITGQLALLILIEMLHLAGIPVVSANTDGIVIKCPRSKADLMEGIVAGWEMLTGFETEATQYTALYSRDVNNYVALKDKGYKGKGAFALDIRGIHKNPTSEICTQAAIKFLRDGTPVEETIRGCTDIRRFVTVRSVKGGALDQAGEYLGKAVRWYYSTLSEGPLTYKVNGYMVPRSEGARALMVLSEQFPCDVDLDWYIAEANDILKQIGATTNA